MRGHLLHVSLQGLKEDIDSRLSRVQEICFEPRLLSEEDDRLKQGSQISQSPDHSHHLPLTCGHALQLPFCFKGCYNYLYRMKALDAIRDSGESSARRFGRWGDFLVYLYIV